MKKTILIISLVSTFLFSGLNVAVSQEQPKPKKDTVNMDSDAKPTFYYAVEDEKKAGKSGSEKGSSSTIIIIAAVVVVAGAAGFFLLKKKK